MTFNEVADLLVSQNYKFAKTMPKHPHSYTLRHNWRDQDKFEQVVLYIRDHGYIEYFYGRPYKMFLVNGFKYWTMGAPLKETILINRAEHKLPGIYDPIADQYSDMFNDPESLKEDNYLFTWLMNIKGRVLDIGCGDGLAVRTVKIPTHSYVGIDPSPRMLEAFRRRHPEYTDCLINCGLESFYDRQGFNTIICTYGSASYIQPAAIERILGNLLPGGEAYFMFYKDDYQPETYKRAGISLDHLKAPAQGQEVFGKYIFTRHINPY